MSFRFVAKIAALASACWMSVDAALAENRIALVIGNANYTAVSSLPNPANDAREMANFLSAAGFQVLQAADLEQRAMLRMIGRFAKLVAASGPDTVTLVFYAGHGLQLDGENYLVPVDAVIQREADVPLQAMRLADLMNALSSMPMKTLIVMLDACRNNPFSEIKKSSGRGLAIVDAPSGALISYSTAPGTEAQDGDGANSPYTAALLKVGREEGVPIEQALKRVRLAVNESTGKQQLPWESSSLTSEFSFFPSERGIIVVSKPAPDPIAEAKSQPRSLEDWQKELKGLSPRAAYETVVRADTVEAYAAYLLAFPSDGLAPLVRRVLERRQEMVAWNQAVTANTPESYETFLTRHAGSDYAPTAKRLKERPRVKRAALAPAASPAPGPTDTDTTTVDTPVVTAVPVYEPPYYHRPHWRHRHPPHDGKPAGAARHDKPGKFAKSARPARVARTAQPTKFAKPAKTPTLSKPTKFAKMSGPAPHTMTANRPTMMKTMNMNTAPRASFGHAGGGGGHRR
jgi:caspase domain-containing protein